MVLEDRTIGGMRAGKRRGVRGDRAASGLGLADLGDDQRLAGAQGLFGDAAEFRRRLDVLEQHQEDVGLALVEHEVDEVGGLENGFVAGGDDVAERQIALARAVEERKAEARRFARSPTPGRCRAAASARSGPALTSIAGLKVGQSAAAILAKPSVFGPLTAMS